MKNESQQHLDYAKTPFWQFCDDSQLSKCEIASITRLGRLIWWKDNQKQTNSYFLPNIFKKVNAALFLVCRSFIFLLSPFRRLNRHLEGNILQHWIEMSDLSSCHQNTHESWVFTRSCNWLINYFVSFIKKTSKKFAHNGKQTTNYWLAWILNSLETGLGIQKQPNENCTSVPTNHTNCCLSIINHKRRNAIKSQSNQLYDQLYALNSWFTLT